LFCFEQHIVPTTIAIMHLIATTASAFRQPLAMSKVSKHAAFETHSLFHLDKQGTSSSSSVASDDDSSTSSTITVACCLKAAERPQLRHQSNNNNKTVRFNEDDNERHDNELLCKEDCKDSWYNAQDYAHFKASTKFLVREIMRNEKRHCQKSIHSYQRVLERTYYYDDDEQQQAASCCHLEQQQQPDEQQQQQQQRKNIHNNNQYHLEQWMRVATCRLGLERISRNGPGTARNESPRLQLQQQHNECRRIVAPSQ
jgi:hypothetical protein